MIEGFPPEIRVQELGDGVRYDLPVWKGGCAFAFALVLLLPALLMTSGGVAGIFIAGGILLANPVNSVVVGIISVFAFMLVLGPIIGLYALWFLFGNTQILLSPDELTATAWLGAFPFARRRWPTAQVTKFVVLSDAKQTAAELLAIGPNRHFLSLASRYSYGWLWYLGSDIAERLNARKPAAPIEVAVEWTDFRGERAEQPARSRIVVQEDDGLVFTIPSAGRWNAMTCFSLLWFGMLLIMSLFLVAVWQGPGALIFAAILGLPFFVGLILLLVGLHLAKRRVIITVRDDQLTVRREGLFGATEKHWAREDLAAINALQEWRKHVTHDANTHATSTTYQLATMLRIEDAKGGVFTLEGNYGMNPATAPAEWEWLATQLRGVFELPGA